jgi:hypothetical protein
MSYPVLGQRSIITQQSLAAFVFLNSSMWGNGAIFICAIAGSLLTKSEHILKKN